MKLPESRHLEMLIADPLLQIAPHCLLVGQTPKDRLAKAEARYDDERGGYPASVHFDEDNKRDQHRYQGNDKSRQLSLIPSCSFSNEGSIHGHYREQGG